MNKDTYSAKSIITNEGLEAMRFRPTEFIPDREHKGQLHVLKEPLDNSNDELNQLGTGTITVVLFRNRTKNTYQVLISDTGRGIPLEENAFLRSLTVFHTSGKYVGNAYKSSAGLYGIGGKLPAALSYRFKALSKCSNGTGLLYLNDSVVKEHVLEYTKSLQLDTGVTIVYELDPQFFRGVDAFMEFGYEDIIAMFRRWGIFLNFRYVFRISDTPINEKFWKASINNSMSILTPYIYGNPDGLNTLYDSDIENNDNYIKQYFNLESGIIWNTEFIKHERNAEDKIEYIVKLFATKRYNQGKLGLINGLFPAMQDNCSHILVFQKALHKYLESFIINKDLQTFYKDSAYKLPLYMLLYVKYNGAEFSGTTKDSFVDEDFSKAYYKDLLESFSKIDNAVWKTYVEYFLSDLEDKYNKFYNKGTGPKNTSLLTLNLIYAKNYKDCDQKGMHCELFLVEGTSASDIATVRSNSFQAVYLTRGVIMNALTTKSKLAQSNKNIRNNKFYKDIIKIMGIDLYRDPELRNLNFGKIILTMDADADGAHINSLHIGDLYALEPKLIEYGFVWIATPPLYTLKLNKTRKTFYARDKMALFDTKINYLYNTVMNISIRDSSDTIINMDYSAYRDFCYLVIEFGELIANTSKLLGIPPLILEHLLHGYQYLYPKIDMDGLNKHFHTETIENYIRLNYMPESELLLVSEHQNDYPISLNDLNREIHETLFPYFKRYKLHLWNPVITSKIDPVHGINNKDCTMMQTYLFFKTIDNTVTCNRYKGLGRMSKEDLDYAITNPSTRSLYHITSVGDVDKLITLMGSDSDGRKDLLFNTTSSIYSPPLGINI